MSLCIIEFKDFQRDGYFRFLFAVNHLADFFRGVTAEGFFKLFDYEGAIHVIPAAKNPVKEAIGILPRRPSLSKKLLKDRATE